METEETKTKTWSNGNIQSSFTKVLYNQITFIIAIVGVVVGVTTWVKDMPQENNVALQLQEQRIVAQRDTIDSLTKTQQNDTQEVKLILQQQGDKLEDLCLSVEKLTTIVEERIPKE